MMAGDMMIGVVLWSDMDDRKAVFWCEDHGDLAYYDASIDSDLALEFFDAGDMVQFEVRMDRKLRKAHSARLVQERACRGLPEKLKDSAARSESAAVGRGSAQIISFTPKPKKPMFRKAVCKA